MTLIGFFLDPDQTLEKKTGSGPDLRKTTRIRILPNFTQKFHLLLSFCGSKVYIFDVLRLSLKVLQEKFFYQNEKMHELNADFIGPLV